MFRNSQDSCDSHLKFLQDRVQLTDYHFANICSTTAAFTQRTAMVRDKGDELAKVLRDYAVADTISKSLRSGLALFSECLTAVEDYRQAAIDRHEVKVTGQLSHYEATCKTAKDNLKKALKAKQRQADKTLQLQRARERAPINRKDVAEAELTKATVDATQAVQQSDSSVDSFENKKLKDLKRVLQDFVKTELHFHAKALELYTKAYNHINAINEEDDMQEFRNCVKMSPPSVTSRADRVRSLAEHSLQASSPVRSSASSTPVHAATDTAASSSSVQQLVEKLEMIKVQKAEEEDSEWTSEKGEDDANESDDNYTSEEDDEIEVINIGHVGKRQELQPS